MLFENVPQLIREPLFPNLIKSLYDLGYYSQWKILNAADFGSAQSRKRVYIVASRDKIPLITTGNGKTSVVYDILHEPEDYNCVFEFKRKYDKPKKKLLLAGKVNDSSYDIDCRIYSPFGLCPTLTTFHHHYKRFIMDYERSRIHDLTPLEYWRLMGFPDKAYYSAASTGLTDSALYTLAGNSIVTNVLTEIFLDIFKRKSYQERVI